MANNKKRSNPKFSKMGKYGGRNNRNKGGAKTFDVEEKFSPEKLNDISWYAHNPQLLKDAASYSFNNALGAPISDKISVQRETDSTWIMSGDPLFLGSVPGIAAIEIVCGPGPSKDMSSPANLAAVGLYSFDRKMNSGAKNYDSPDLMMYLLAMDSLYYMWNWGQRAYGLIMNYSQYNRYMPKALVNASGFNFEDIEINIADFRQYLNITASKIASFCVPQTLPYMKRHSWMFSNVYKDSDIYKAQMYIFRPANYYVWTEPTETAPQKLTFMKIPNGMTTFSQYRSMMNSMIDAVQQNEDVAIMSGDVLKAWGDSGMFTLSPVKEDYAVGPVYNEEVLTQIHNMSAPHISQYVVNGSWDILQDPTTNAIVWDPKIDKTKYHCAPSAKVINFPWDNVTPENVMYGTRLSSWWEYVGNYYQCITSGTEIAIGIDIYYYETTGSLTILPNLGTDLVHTFNNDTLSQARLLMKAVQTITNFDWYPITYFCEREQSNANLRFILGDLANYTVFGKDDFYKLHETAVLSEFNVPMLGQF